MAKYTIGVDFGTLSARALLVDTADGRELASVAMDYTHGVMDHVLCTTGEPLPPDYALQHPADYLEALCFVVPAVVREAGVNAADVVGLGIDFTCCTFFPVDEMGTPLCFLPQFEKTPLAFALLWKHHAAHAYADRLTALARERAEKFLSRCGGKIDPEWTLPKLAQVMWEAPEVFAAADRFVEGGDFLVQTVTGERKNKSYQIAAYKVHYSHTDGYPSVEFLDAAYRGCGKAVLKKLRGDLLLMGSCAGHLTAEYAERLGLCAGTAVAVATPDAHCTGAAVGLSQKGDMLTVLGTSGCFMTLGERELAVPGICGCVKDGVVPGLYGYEAGLCSLGDHFAFAAENLTSPAYAREAQARGMKMLPLLLEKAAKKKAGESGLVALNWFNGNRSVLTDSTLSGCFVGLTLASTPEDMLRALIESTAFGLRNIVDNFEEHGLAVRRIIAAGGIARKDPFTMQLYADVLGREVAVTATAQGPARGVAIGAAAAAGVYPDLQSAVAAMHAPIERVYTPCMREYAVYDRLYMEYRFLHDYFGRGENGVMARLRALAAEQKGN